MHRGAVIIAYDQASDYYVIFLRNESGDRKVAEEVGFEELGSIIDRYVESGDNAEDYASFCKEEFNKFLSGNFL
jgi:hypothetical protein